MTARRRCVLLGLLSWLGLPLCTQAPAKPAPAPPVAAGLLTRVGAEALGKPSGYNAGHCSRWPAARAS